MTRDEMLDKLLGFTLPLGPFVTYEEWEARESEWLRSASPDWLPILFEIMLNPPLIVGKNNRRSSWSVRLMNAMEAAAACAPQVFFEMMEPLLPRLLAAPLTGSVVVSVIGSVRSSRSFAYLKYIYSNYVLSEDAWLWLASAFEELRSPESVAMLHKMQQEVPPNMPEAARELDRAIAWVASHPR